MKDDDMIALLQSRDESGLSSLLLHFGPLMRYVIAPIVQNTEDREECLSEATLRVWDQISVFDPERGSFTAWLTAVTRNIALNRARQNRRLEGQEPLAPNMPSPEPSPEEALLHKERQSILAAAVRQLSQRDQLLFYRKYYYRQSTAQIASETGMSERAVEGRLYRLKQKLRAQLGGAFDG